MLHVLRATSKWLLALGVGLATWLAIIGAASAGTLPTTSSQPIDPRAFTTCAQLPPHVDLKGLMDT